MQFSIFTPTHNPAQLRRLQASLSEQTLGDFEWIVVPNGGCKGEDLGLTPDPRTLVVPYMGASQNIGEIKKFCCSQASGDVLVEVDHDDELTPDCLAALAETFDDPGVDFAYSNCCEVTAEGQPFLYSEVFGWRYRPYQWKNLDLKECLAFPPTPASFSKVWFAPNHVRAWRRSFYNRIGGHDPSLEVCDDHDLACRSYLHGSVRHIDRCLYIYHYTGANTCMGAKNQLIQDMTLGIHDRYIYQLAEKWSDENGLRKIDLCGGFDSPQQYESVDLLGGDITANLEEPWPFEDGSVGVIRAHDAIEHLRDPIHTMKEAYRCLAPSGWFLILVPSSEERGGIQDPTHVSWWNSNSMWYYCREQQARYINTPTKFQLNRIKNYYPSDWHAFHKILYVKADLLKFDPTKRVAGLIEI